MDRGVKQAGEESFFFGPLLIFSSLVYSVLQLSGERGLIRWW